MKKILLFFFIASTVYGQTVSGTIYNQVSRRPLPNCNISVLGTNRGTISNNVGKYKLKLTPGNYHILFQYMGYHSDTLQIIIKNKDIPKTILLTPQIYLADDIIIFAGQYSEAEQIILRASKEKRKALNLVHNYFCKSYTKLTLSRDTDSLKNIYGLLYEVYSELVWNVPDNWHEIVRSQKTSSNLPESFNFLSGNTFLNINADRIQLGDKTLIGPTAPDAIEYYHFEILDTLYQDKRRIFKMSFRPKNNQLPLMTGNMFLIDDLFIVKKIDVALNKQAQYGLFEDIHIVQQYKAFNDSIYLPLRSLQESVFIIDFPGYPRLKYRKSNFREDYRINEPQNSSHLGQTKIYFQNDLPFDSIPMNAPPLAPEEEKGYTRIDSVLDHNITINMMTKSIKIIDYYAWFKSLPVGGFSDFYHFNRVEGNNAGAALNFKNRLNPFRLYAGFGYGTADQKSKYFIFPGFFFSKGSADFGIKFGFYKRLAKRDVDTEFPVWLNSLYGLFSNTDYFDYYYTDGSELNLIFSAKPFLLSASYVNENQHQASRNIMYGFFDNHPFIANPEINEGRLSGFNLQIIYSTAAYRESDLFKRRFVYRNYVETVFSFESGLEEWGSDFTFKRYHFLLFLRRQTFYKGIMDLILSSGFGSNGLPLQRYFELESGDLAGYDRFKTFRTLSQNTFTGQKKLAVYFEHNFQNSIFQLGGLPGIKDIPWDLSFIYNLGWAGNKNLRQLNFNDFYSELGFGIGRVFNILKFEFIWGLKQIPQSKNFTFTLKMNEIEF